MDWEGLGAARGFVVDALRRGAEEIRERGWVQGRFVAENGAVDVVQALGLAAGIDVAHSHTRGLRLPAGSCVLLGAVLQAARDGAGCPVLSVWNDLDTQTAEAVEAALERAADALAE